jgi:hypothetical protein
VKKIQAFHFVGKTLRDGSPIPRNGKVLKFPGPNEKGQEAATETARSTGVIYINPIESGAELDEAIADIFAIRKISDDKYAVEFI